MFKPSERFETVILEATNAMFWETAIGELVTIYRTLKSQI
jgi:hypothetical protein